MTYETNCTEINIEKWKQLMRYARPCSYRLLVKRIQKEIPSLYQSLALEFRILMHRSVEVPLLIMFWYILL